MPQQYTYGFIVTPSFNTTCSEAMTQTMILQFWYVKLHHQIIIVIAICTRLSRTFVVGKHIKIVIEYFFNGFIIASNSLLIGISRQEFLVLGVLIISSVCFSRLQ